MLSVLQKQNPVIAPIGYIHTCPQMLFFKGEYPSFMHLVGLELDKTLNPNTNLFAVGVSCNLNTHSLLISTLDDTLYTFLVMEIVSLYVTLEC